MKKEFKSIDEIFDDLPEENKKRVLETMAKYGDNKWWAYEDSVEVAKYQIFEDILMVPFGKYHEGVEKLLGRPVWTHEFGINAEGLRQEAKEAIKRLEKGESLERGPEYQTGKIAESFRRLNDFAKDNNKKVIYVAKS
ncbi:hypothetical protein J4458_02855 [Candidatus Woesearchaeota archaeon]|nr:hypothetical protein [Candidatus Woesearchaeota archaeon]